MSWYRWQGEDLFMQVQLQPRARRDEFAGVLGDRLKVRVRAAPIEGKANLCLIEFLARAFATPKERVVLLRGQSSRAKLLRLRAPARLPPELGIEVERARRPAAST